MTMSLQKREKNRLYAASIRMNLNVNCMEVLAGDVSRRRYVRLFTESGSRIACCYPEPFDGSETSIKRFFRLREVDPRVRLSWASDPVAFIESTEWFSRIGIPVPEI